MANSLIPLFVSLTYGSCDVIFYYFSFCCCQKLSKFLNSFVIQSCVVLYLTRLFMLFCRVGFQKSSSVDGKKAFFPFIALHFETYWSIDHFIFYNTIQSCLISNVSLSTPMLLSHSSMKHHVLLKLNRNYQFPYWF